MNLEERKFINENIENLNNGVSSFFKNNSHINKTNALNYLNEKLQVFIKEQENRTKLYEKIKEKKFVKAEIKNIANEFGFYESDLKKFYRTLILKKVFESNIDYIDELTNSLQENIKSHMDAKEFSFISAEYKKLVKKAIYMTLKSGFSDNLTNVNFGVMVANAGDAAEFLFVARAILSGFNCSSVDVRSSRYDAIIDFESKLLRVQIKGISGNQISFKDRDRGGQGIDHTNETNKGQRITSKDCDIYVAVDKQVGILYIIPMSYVDKLDDNELNKTTDNLEQFKENWDVITKVVKDL